MYVCAHLHLWRFRDYDSSTFTLVRTFYCQIESRLSLKQGWGRGLSIEKEKRDKRPKKIIIYVEIVETIKGGFPFYCSTIPTVSI